jgi:hypothetical protein
MKSIAKVWIFPSSSGKAKYETLLYDDLSTSCNCPGWTRRVAPDGKRSCRHTRLADMGYGFAGRPAPADAACESMHDYRPSAKIDPDIEKKMNAFRDRVYPPKPTTTKADSPSPAMGYSARKLCL